MARLGTVLVTLCLLAGIALAGQSDSHQSATTVQPPPGRAMQEQRMMLPVLSTADGTDAVTIPRLLSYQGKLTDSTTGVPVSDTTYPVTFRLYTVPSGGSAFWNETQTVRCKDGLFSTLLGSVTPIGSMPDAGAAYLGMQVGSGPELSPRLRLASTAYSFLAERAANADLLQGRDTTTLSRSTHNHDATYVNEGQADAVTSTMVVNGTVEAVDLGQMGASTGQVMKWTGSAWQPRNDSIGGSGGNGTVTSVGQTTGIVCSPNPITSTGTVGFDAAYGDGRYINEGQSAGGDLAGAYPSPTIGANAVGSNEVTNASLRGVDIALPCTLTYNGFDQGLVINCTNEGTGLLVDRPAVSIGMPAIHGKTQGSNGCGVLGEAVGSGNYSAGVSGHAEPGGRPGVLGYNSSGVFLPSMVDAGVAAYSENGPAFYASGAANDGVRVDSVGESGVWVQRAGRNGFEVDSAALRGVHVSYAGQHGVSVDSAGWSGFGVNRAAYYGLHVGCANSHGVYVRRARGDGLCVDTADQNGVYVSKASDDAFEAGSVNYGLYAPNANVYGAWTSAATAGGRFGTTSVNGVGVIAESYRNSSSDTAILAYGRGYASGGWYTGDLEGSREAPCVISPERGIVAAGHARLADGAASVQLDPIVVQNIRSGTSIRVAVTPCGRPGGTLYVSQSDPSGFTVELEAIPGLASDSDCAFDWIAFAMLRESTTSASAQAELERTEAQMRSKVHLDSQRPTQDGWDRSPAGRPR